MVEGNQNEEQEEWWREQKNRIGMSPCALHACLEVG
jgi:hypothetical protein